MIFFTAIDIKNGMCVRLLRGDINKVTVFNKDPAAQGKVFEDAGCEWIHVVDLNGAFEGKPVNGTTVGSIIEAITSCPISENDIILITGSLYLAGEVLNLN